jgi:hypothetical protein
MRARPRSVTRSRAGLLLLWLAVGLCTASFLGTEGLVAVWSTEADVEYTHEQLSGGDDDDVCIAMGLFFAALGLGWNGLRVLCPLRRADLVAHGLLLGLQGLYLFAIDTGSLWKTVLLGGNVPLASWLLAYAGLCLTLLGSLRPDRS